MMVRKFQAGVLVALGAALFMACSSGRSEAMKPGPQDSTELPTRQDPAPPAHPSSPPDAGATSVCQPRTCASSGKLCGQVSDGCGGVIDCGRCARCAPDEMNCCGACIPKSEQRCPENVHCPTSLPEM